MIAFSRSEAVSDAKQSPFSMPNLEPIDDQVIIRTPKKAKETAGGIALPDGARVTTDRFGVVIAVGPGAMRANPRPGDGDRYPMQVKVGDKVLMPNGFYHFPLDDTTSATREESEIWVGHQHQLLAIIRPEA
jgi:co-chaperonin GroES (HSP10)